MANDNAALIIALSIGGGLGLVTLIVLWMRWRKRAALWREVSRRTGLPAKGSDGVSGTVAGAQLNAHEYEYNAGTVDVPDYRRSTRIRAVLATPFPPHFNAGTDQRSVISPRVSFESPSGRMVYVGGASEVEVDEALSDRVRTCFGRFFDAVAEARVDTHGDQPDGWLDELKQPLQTIASVSHDHRAVTLDGESLIKQVEAFVRLATELESASPDRPHR